MLGTFMSSRQDVKAVSRPRNRLVQKKKITKALLTSVYFTVFFKERLKDALISRLSRLTR